TSPAMRMDATSFRLGMAATLQERPRISLTRGSKPARRSLDGHSSRCYVRVRTGRREMEFRLLGPVELEGERGAVSLGSAEQRTLLSVLVLYRNEVVSQGRLVDELWGDAPPASAAHSVEAYVSRLRKTLHDAGADGILSTRGGGYVLDVNGERYDVVRFEELL